MTRFSLIFLPLLCSLAVTTPVVLAQNSPANTPGAATGANPPATDPPTTDVRPSTPVTEEQAEESEAPGLRAGADLYYGFSNLDGFRRFRDGFWAAGAGLAYPSSVYLRYTSPQNAQARLAVSVGALYNGSTNFDQPVEAWWKQPLRGNAGSVTLGKFYVPFALQEWQYETKWGAQWEREWGANNLAAALVYNRNTDNANGYVRLGHNFGENVSVGVSLAGGRGLTYDTVHDKAIGLDLTATRGDWQLLAEYMGARASSAQRFRFLWGRLNYDGWQKFKPFVARYDYRDTSGALGNFRSYSVGSSYQLRSDLVAEGGHAFTNTNNIWWIQLHWTPEKLLR